MDPKEAAARRAVTYIQNTMTLGLGTGATAAHVVRALAERIARESLRVRAVPTSARTHALAESLGIPLVDLSDAGTLDLVIDGADEVDPSLALIKGGGGALVREKLVAAAGRDFYVVCAFEKLKPMLGAFPLPVAVLPFGWKTTLRRLEHIAPHTVLREMPEKSGEPYLTDDGLYILDMYCGSIPDPPGYEARIKHTVGVVEVGLFVGMAQRVIAGCDDGQVEERAPAADWAQNRIT